MTKITNKKRKQYRELLKLFKSFIDPLKEHLETKKPMDPVKKAWIDHLIQNPDPNVQLSALFQQYDTANAEYDYLLKIAAPNSMSCFSEYMDRGSIPAAHHEFLMTHMEAVYNKEIMRLMISLPPGSAKTTYSSINFAAWYLGNRPNDRWLQGAHTMQFVKDRLGKPVRGLISEPRYRDIFPEMVLSASSSAADFFEFAGKRGSYKGVGVGTAVAGFRGEIGAIDDPIGSWEDAESPTTRRKLHDWYSNDFALRPMPGSPIYIVSTRWHEDDLIGHELHKMANGSGTEWTVINIPALALENDPLGRNPGDGLWPEIFGKEWYTTQKISMSGRAWNALYQGNPVDEEGGVLKRDKVARYKNVPKDEVQAGKVAKKVVKRITLSVDCAEKATNRSDFSAATVWMETTDRHHYLIHATRIKAEFTELSLWIDNLASLYEVESILVEDRGAGTQYIQIRQVSPGPAPVIAIATKQKSKEFRFDGVTPMFSSGEVLLPDAGTDWIADVEAELFAFPNGKNDDFVDSISQYLADARDRRGQGRRGVAKNRSSQKG